MVNYSIVLTPAEDQALSYAALSQQDWIDNLVKERCRVATEEIVQKVVQKCLDTGTQVPVTKDDIVALGFEKGWVKTLAAVQQDIEQQVLGQ